MNEDANKHLYRWKKSTSKHDSKLGAKVNESNNIRKLFYIYQYLICQCLFEFTIFIQFVSISVVVINKSRI